MPITMQPPGTAVLSAAASAIGSAAPSKSTISRSRSRGQSPMASAASIVPSRMLALPLVAPNRSAEIRDIATESETNAMALIAVFSSPAADEERWRVAEADMTGLRARAGRAAAGSPAGTATAAATATGADLAATDDAGRVERLYLALAIARDRRGIDGGVGRSGRASDRRVARPRQHLAEIVGGGAAQSRHDALVGVGDGCRAVGRAVVDPEQVLGAHDDDGVRSGRHRRLDRGADPARAGIRQALADPLRAQALHRAARTVRDDDELVTLGAPTRRDDGLELAHLAGVRPAGARREIDGHHGVGPYRIEARVVCRLLDDRIGGASRKASGGEEHEDG